MYIDDCLYGIDRIMHSDILEPINLGSNELVTINQLVDIAEDIAGIKLKRRYKLDAPKGVNGRNSDNTRIRQYLDWEPSIRLRDGMAKTYAWIREQYLAQAKVPVLVGRCERNAINSECRSWRRENHVNVLGRGEMFESIPRVSIGLPVYNGQDYLAAAIDSLLAQSFTDFELIISDNGSTDRTPEICRQYAARDKRNSLLSGSGKPRPGLEFQSHVQVGAGRVFQVARARRPVCADIAGQERSNARLRFVDRAMLIAVRW